MSKLPHVLSFEGLTAFARASFRVGRQFEFILDLSPEQCSAQLLALSESKKGFWNPSSLEVRIQEDVGIYRYQANLIRYGRGISYTSSSVNGLIKDDGRTGKTIVSCQTQIGLVFLLVIIFPLCILLANVTTFVKERDILWVAIVFLICSFYVIRFVNDYNRISHQFYDTLLKMKNASGAAAD